MKYSIKTLAILSLFTLFSFAQKNNDLYKIKYDVLKVLAKKTKINNAFHASSSVSVKKTSKKVKRINKQYNILKNEILVLEKQKKIAVEQYQEKLKNYNEIRQIDINLKQFLSSKKPYVAKKHLLESSQLLADKYKINELIYADKYINTSSKSKFLIFELTPIKLKIHLRRVVPKIEKRIPLEPTLTYDAVPLNELKKTLKNTKPYYYDVIKGKNIKTKKIIANGKVKDHSLLTGNIKKLYNCFVITKQYKNILHKNQIISFEKIEEMDLRLREINYKELTLIQNLDNNELYVVENNFLTHFGFKVNR